MGFWGKKSYQTSKIPSVLNHGCVLDSAVICCNLIGCTGAEKEDPEL